MKKLVFLFFNICLIYQLISQPCNTINFRGDTLRCDVYTPNDNLVITWAMKDTTLQARQSIDNRYAILFPFAQQVSTYDNVSSTQRYNCHGYAWLLTEGGYERWIGYYPAEVGTYPDIYMSDESYVQVAVEAHPAKVFWDRPSDHSAITTEQKGIVISKWIRGPLMIHHVDYNHPFGTNYKYFVVKPEYPAHCDNCIQDEDETELDCGGSCPPCSDAPDNRVIDQNNLKRENNALENISTTGSVVLNGGSYKFISGKGITFNAGFKVEAGTEFKATVTPKPGNLTRSFRKVCTFIPNLFTPNNDGVNDLFGLSVAGVTHISVEIFNRWNNSVKTLSRPIYEDGFTPLWDGKNSAGTDYATGTYFYIIDIYTYEGKQTQQGYITLLR